MALFLTKKINNKDAVVYVWDMSETEDELWSLTYIPNEAAEEIRMTANPQRRKEKLAEWALLNTIFDGKVYLGHHDNGRPYLHNSLTELSISHDSRFVAIITSPQGEDLGIDIENLDRDFSAVEAKALSEDEKEDLNKQKRQLQLAIYWCAKEAIFKRMSLNGVNYAEQIEVGKFNPRIDGDDHEIHATFTFDDGVEMEFDPGYMIFENHVMVWVVG
ncbi:MAG: 4'-phosphopantetheinyl transferase superfamily protein [Bacteroidales bacterium]|jgi:4'-phosphopantetheinyl transferase EntD|nr:4'-phosphopantetheinyl transferase superfamily protein [Bacteroidales bacterium]MCI2144948.1 4'-phosphopantetheinyl transferase superfamily protein [Bacteroidales bacterium]